MMGMGFYELHRRNGMIHMDLVLSQSWARDFWRSACTLTSHERHDMAIAESATEIDVEYN